MIYARCFIIGFLFLLMGRSVKSRDKKGFQVQHFRSHSFLWITRENETMILLDDFHFRSSLCTVSKDGLIIKLSDRKELPVLINKKAISIMMKNGKIRFHYKNLDSDEECTLTADPKVNDGSWHDVEVHWNGQFIEIWLDSSQMNKTTCFQQKHSADDPIEDIILGAAVTLHRKESMFNVYDDFQGCMMNSRLNKRPLDDIFTLSFENNVDEGCSTDNDCQKVKCPSPMSFNKRECRCPGDMIATDDGETCRMRCRNDICLNGGICIEKGLEIACNCSAGYSGPTCSTDDPCSLLPCLNNGTCINNGSQFLCHCAKDFGGKKCEEHRKESDPKPDNTVLYYVLGFLVPAIIGALIIIAVLIKWHRGRSRDAVDSISIEGGNQGLPANLPGSTNLSQNLRKRNTTDSPRTRCSIFPSVFQQKKNCRGKSALTSVIDDQTNGNLRTHEGTQTDDSLFTHDATETDENPETDRNNRITDKDHETERNNRKTNGDLRNNRNREDRQTYENTQVNDDDSGIDEDPETNGNAPITDYNSLVIDENSQANDNTTIADENTRTDDNTPVTDEDHRTDANSQVIDENPQTDDNTLVTDKNSQTNDNIPIADEDTRTDDHTPVTDEDTRTDDNTPVTDEDHRTDANTQVIDENPQTDDNILVTDKNSQTNDNTPVTDEDHRTDGNTLVNDKNPRTDDSTPETDEYPQTDDNTIVNDENLQNDDNIPRSDKQPQTDENIIVTNGDLPTDENISVFDADSQTTEEFSVIDKDSQIDKIIVSFQNDANIQMSDNVPQPLQNSIENSPETDEEHQNVSSFHQYFEVAI